MGAASHRALHRSILRSVSRSFYLWVRLLPSGLREPVGLAYLLARATDSIADTTEGALFARRTALEILAPASQGQGSADPVADLGRTFGPLQENAAERRLIESLPECL